MKTLPLWAKISVGCVGVILLLFLVLGVRSCNSTEYWHGQFDAAFVALADRDSTILELEKKARDREEELKKVPLLRGKIDSLETVIAGKDDALGTSTGEIKDLKKKVLAAMTIEQQGYALEAVVEAQDKKISLLETQLGDVRKVLGLTQDELKLYSASYVSLKIDYDKLMTLYKDTDHALNLGKTYISRLEFQTKAMKAERFIERLAVVAGGLYFLVKK